MAPGNVPEVTPADAHQREPEAVLLDVREPDEWEAGHAPGALHMALGTLGLEYGRLPEDAPILCVCRGGGRSEKAATALRSAGYDASNVVGGMKSWQAGGLPVVTDDGRPGAVI
ncbi:MAG: rhodanese-like domain-containing protein [Acidimicrobiales bacterium]